MPDPGMREPRDPEPDSGGMPASAEPSYTGG